MQSPDPLESTMVFSTAPARPARAEVEEMGHYLLILEGGQAGQRFEIGDQPLLIGREAGCGLVLADGQVSRRHCQIESHWAKAYDRPPPKGISRRLLEYVAAYHAQVTVGGHLGPATKRLLQRTAGLAATAKKEDDRPTARRLSVGTRLVREWHGRFHTVDVGDTGFQYEGRLYGSLSAIARTITGARWSGQRFFRI